MVFNFFLKSYFISSALNPLTYGIFNTKFRQFFISMVCACRYKTSGTFSSNSDSVKSSIELNWGSVYRDVFVLKSADLCFQYRIRLFGRKNLELCDALRV